MKSKEYALAREIRLSQEKIGESTKTHKIGARQEDTRSRNSLSGVEKLNVTCEKKSKALISNTNTSGTISVCFSLAARVR